MGLSFVSEKKKKKRYNNIEYSHNVTITGEGSFAPLLQAYESKKNCNPCICSSSKFHILWTEFLFSGHPNSISNFNLRKTDCPHIKTQIQLHYCRTHSSSSNLIKQLIIVKLIQVQATRTIKWIKFQYPNTWFEQTHEPNNHFYFNIFFII